ncbi:hypothetical protein [Kitasatospora sp. NPDC059673]|uniref:hypothetical protein n=1 Tax=Kitasatospora sp. NPDC059673 TaxID=3346901 RepID=UPI003690AAE6
MQEPDDLRAGLNDIDWSALGHAYGSAEDVPGDLRAVCAPDEAARESGSRYSGSAYAVPFLARIAVAGPPGARADTLMLLTRLAIDRHDTYDLPLGIDTTARCAATISPEESLRWCDEEIAAETDESWLRLLRAGRAYCAAGTPHRQPRRRAAFLRRRPRPTPLPADPVR